jgi:hypothetical protein
MGSKTKRLWCYPAVQTIIDKGNISQRRARASNGFLSPRDLTCRATSQSFTSRFARNPRLRPSAPKISFIGECTLNDPARIQPSLAPSAGSIRRRHRAYCGAMRLFAQPLLDASAVVSSTSKLCHYGSPQMAKWLPGRPRQSNSCPRPSCWRFATGWTRICILQRRNYCTDRDSGTHAMMSGVS